MSATRPGRGSSTRTCAGWVRSPTRRRRTRWGVLRFGRLVGPRKPGFNVIMPFVDRMTKISLRVVTMVLEPQEVITRDNVTVKVDAVVYFMVIDPVKAVINVEDYRQGTNHRA